MSIDLTKVPIKDLFAELDRRDKKRIKGILKKCVEKCSKCGKLSPLSEWSKVICYYIEDNVYTTAEIKEDDFYIVSPCCEHHDMAMKKYRYASLTPTKRDNEQLELYKRVMEFEGVGDFKHEYHMYKGGYGQEPTYYERNIDSYEKKKIKDPFKK